jgi:conjugal transfer pilin signal peptidase TrbI
MTDSPALGFYDRLCVFWGLARAWWSRWWLAAIVFVATLLIGSHYVTLVVNVTESLPHHVYLVLKQDRAVVRGDYAAFLWTGNRPYPSGLSFIKQVAGVPGDVVTVDANRRFQILEAPSAAELVRSAGEATGMAGRVRDVGEAKRYGSVGNMEGVPLELGFQGVIPVGRLYMHGWHADSLDSRYALLGLVDEARILGRAIPLF